MVLTGSRDIRNTNSVKSAQASRDSRRKVILVTKNQASVWCATRETLDAGAKIGIVDEYIIGIIDCYLVET